MPQEVPYFVKANKVDLPTDINPLWSDAENLLFLQPPLGINSACGQGSGDGGRHSHGEEEEGHSHYFCHRLLQAARATGGEVGATAPPATEQRTPSSDHGFILLLSVLSLHAHTSSSSRLDRRSRRYSSGLGAGAQPGSTACTYLVVREHTHSIYQSQHADGGEAYDELEGISVELEVHGLGVEDGSHQVTFSSVEPCVKTRALHHLSDKVVAWQPLWWLSQKQMAPHRPQPSGGSEDRLGVAEPQELQGDTSSPISLLGSHFPQSSQKTEDIPVCSTTALTGPLPVSFT